MVTQTHQPEPSHWEKRWRRIEVVSSVLLTLIGALIALFLGRSQLILGENQLSMATSQLNIAKNQENIATIGMQIERYKALADLILALGDDEKPGVRRQAARALAQFGEPAIPPLLLALGDDNKEVQLATIDALTNIYELYKTSEVHKQVSNRLEEEIGRIGEKKNENIIEASILIIFKINRDSLIDILKHSKDLLRIINVIEERKHLKILVYLLDSKEFYENRASIAYAIRKIAIVANKSDIQDLIELSKMESFDENTRVDIVIILDNVANQSKHEDVLSPIKNAFLYHLKSNNDRLSIMAASNLVKFCYENEIYEALMTLQKDENNIRRGIARLVLERDECKRLEKEGSFK